MVRYGLNYWNDYYWGGHPFNARWGNPWAYGYGYGNPYYSEYPYEMEQYHWDMTDDEIHEEVSENLQEVDIPRRDKKNIRVEVTGGIVTLSGVVSSRRCKWEAYSMAYWSDGVVDVINNLKVEKPEVEETPKRIRKK